MTIEVPHEPGLFDDDPNFVPPSSPEPVDVDAIIASIVPPKDPYASDRDREERKNAANPGRETNPRASLAETEVDDADDILRQSKTAARTIVADIPKAKAPKPRKSRRAGRYRGTADFSDDPRDSGVDLYPHFHGQPDFFPSPAQVARNHRGAAVGAALIKLNKDSRESEERKAEAQRISRVE